MITVLITICAFTLGIKIIALQKLLVLRQKYPEKTKYYNSLIKLAQMFIIPTAALLAGTLIFLIWKANV